MGERFFLDAAKTPAVVTNRYGVYVTVDHSTPVPGEDLAVKAIFPGRIVRVFWDGRVEVEPVGEHP